MDLQQELHKNNGFGNLELLARQVVEGFISGMHRSPFHGFSSEFAEHKVYNQGESTKHIDWKLYARTDRLYTKKYEEETNLRCHLILDNSSSMHYPELLSQNLSQFNKIGFSALASASIMQLMKRQRDAVGMSIYSTTYDFYAGEKGSDRHRHLLLDALEKMIHPAFAKAQQQTDTYTHLHLIAEKLKRRSLVFLFSDMLQQDVAQESLFEALRHLKYNQHEVVLFHTYSEKEEVKFDFDNSPKRFVDIETGEYIDLYADNVRKEYEEAVTEYFEALRLKCSQYQIKYVPARLERGFQPILSSFLVERQKFI